VKAGVPLGGGVRADLNKLANELGVTGL